MPSKRKFPWFSTLLLMIIVGAVIVIGAGAGILINYSETLPPITPLDDYLGDPEKWSLPSKVLDRNNQMIAEFATEKRDLATYRELPELLVNAFVAAEDNRFFKHRGVDFFGILRAASANILAGGISQGGSTITQQLAKQLFLTKEKTLDRKVREALLAIKIEQKYTKHEILERYLNKIYFGHGCYGIKEASRFYFNKPLASLTVAECSYLAGLPKAPSRYSLIDYPQRARERQGYVLGNMVELGYTSEDSASLSLKQFWDSWQPDTAQMQYRRSLPFTASGYLAEAVRQKLELDEFEDYAIYRGGLTIETTFDIALQKEAEKILAGYLKIYNEDFHKRKPSMSHLKIEGAIITIKNRTGEIMVAAGGSGFNVNNQLNRVFQVFRQPGSSFKPFLYLAALDSGKFTPSSLVLDQPAYYFPYQGAEAWVPQNYEGKYRGWITMRYALEHSINVAAIRLFEDLSPPEMNHFDKMLYSGNLVIDYARKCGITSRLEPVWSLPLGSFDVSPYEIAAAYTVFANQGVAVPPYFIKTVRDQNQNILKQYYVEENEVISRDVAYLLTHILEGVVRRGTAAYSIGSHFPGRPLAGKTGTTNDFVDAWFVGYSPQYTTAVWIGFDQGRTTLGPKMAGGRVAGPIWADFNQILLKDEPPEPFSRPENVALISVCYESGKLPGADCTKIIEEAFIQGTEPDEECSMHSDAIHGDGGMFDLGLPEESIENPDAVSPGIDELGTDGKQPEPNPAIDRKRDSRSTF